MPAISIGLTAGIKSLSPLHNSQSSSQLVRTSSGNLYAILATNTNGTPNLKVRVFKSTDNGLSWSLKDYSNSPITGGSPTPVTAAIDSSDTIHIGFARTNTSYVQFSASTDTFGKVEFVNASNATSLAISVDGNNVPHICWGTSGSIWRYSNRTSGVWGTQVTLFAVGAATTNLDLQIDQNNVPQITAVNSVDGLLAVIGNKNNASSFTSVALSTAITTAGGTSLTIDASGNTYVAYQGARDSAIQLLKHNQKDAWSTWQTAVTNGFKGKSVSLAADANDIYVFYERNDGGIAYDRYDTINGKWLGEQIIQPIAARSVNNVGFHNPFVKWSQYFNNGDTGANNTSQDIIEYLFDDGSTVYYDKLVTAQISTGMAKISFTTAAGGTTTSTSSTSSSTSVSTSTSSTSTSTSTSTSISSTSSSTSISTSTSSTSRSTSTSSTSSSTSISTSSTSSSISTSSTSSSISTSTSISTSSTSSSISTSTSVSSTSSSISTSSTSSSISTSSTSQSTSTSVSTSTSSTSTSISTSTSVSSTSSSTSLSTSSTSSSTSTSSTSSSISTSTSISTSSTSSSTSTSQSTSTSSTSSSTSLSTSSTSSSTSVSTSSTSSSISTSTTTTCLGLDIGAFTKPVATGTQQIAGLLAQPKALILFSAGATATNTFRTFSRHMMGMATSSTDDYALSSIHKDTGATRTFHGVTAIDGIYSGAMLSAGGEEGHANLTSLNVYGFTLNWTTANSDAVRIGYMGIHGGDITNVKVIKWTQPTSNGNFGVTGVGFRPDLLIHLHIGDTAGWGGWVSGTDSGALAMGATDGVNQWVTHSSAEDNIAATNVKRQQWTDASIGSVSSGGAVNSKASIVSFDADGFTYNFSTATTGADVVTLCIKGGDYKVGSFNKNTATGSQAISSVGFLPQSIMLAGYGAATSASAIDNYGFIFGAGNTSSSEAMSTYVSDATSSSSTVGSSLQKSGAVYVKTNDGASPAILAEASLTSLDSNGFTLNWTTNDAVADEVLYIAMACEGSATTTSTSSTSSSTSTSSTSSSTSTSISTSTSSTSRSTSTSISTSSTSTSVSTSSTSSSTSLSTSSTSSSTSVSSTSQSTSTSKSTSTSSTSTSVSTSISTSSTSSSISTSSTSTSISTSSTSSSTSTSQSTSTSSTSSSTSISTSVSTSSTSTSLSTSSTSSSTSVSTSISTSSTSTSVSTSISVSTSSTSTSTTVSATTSTSSTSSSISTSSTSSSTSISTSSTSSSTSISTSSTSRSTSTSSTSSSTSVSTSTSTSSTSQSTSTSLSTSSTSSSTSTSLSTSSTSQSTSTSLSTTTTPATTTSTSSTSTSFSSTSTSASTSTTVIDVNTFPRGHIPRPPMRFRIIRERIVFK